MEGHKKKLLALQEARRQKRRATATRARED